MQFELVSKTTEAITYPPCVTGRSAAVNEEHLVAEAQRGSSVAFQQLVNCYESPILTCKPHCNQVILPPCNVSVPVARKIDGIAIRN